MNTLDLNLLNVLATVIEEKSVSAAARRLHITQPAVSGALARLREFIGDPLLVKKREGMVPTPRAAELMQSARAAIDDIQRAVNADGAFDPARCEVEFRMAATDCIVQLVVPQLVAAMRAEMPLASLRITRVDMEPQEATAAAGANHLVMAVADKLPRNLRSVQLIAEDWILLSRADHPQIGAKVSLAQYAELPHAVGMMLNNDGRTRVDEMLASHGLARFAPVHMQTAFPIVNGRSDFVSTVPIILAEERKRLEQLKTTELPFRHAPFRQHMIWHRKYDDSGMHRWFRAHVTRICESLRTSRQREAAAAE